MPWSCRRCANTSLRSAETGKPFFAALAFPEGTFIAAMGLPSINISDKQLESSKVIERGGKMEQILSMLYGISGVAALGCYLPQLMRYHRDPQARASISISSWGGWIAVTLVTLLYAVFVQKSGLFAGVTAMNAAAQGVVLAYGIRGRLGRGAGGPVSAARDGAT